MPNVKLTTVRFPSIKKIDAPFSGELGQKIGQAMKRSIAREFASESFASRSGSYINWIRTSTFGRLKPPSKTLSRSGGLRESWQSSPVITTPRTVSIRSNKDYASIVRGGTGADPLARLDNVRATKTGKNGIPSMFWLLGLKFGVWISPKKLISIGLRSIPRRHAASNPALVREISDLITEDLIVRIQS